MDFLVSQRRRDAKVIFKNDVSFKFHLSPFFKYSTNDSLQNYCPSPDGRENPFGAGFAPKRLEGQQDQAPYYS
ncbi:hypothetical protein EV144_109111 [Flavobacterium sp. 270]|nr:hypothetical protein EV144_109111 [Flavobacterium sp. 270]